MIGKPSLTAPAPARPLQSGVSTWALLRLVLGLMLLGAIWLGIAPTRAVPAVVPATAPASEFSAERAMGDLRVVAAEPHPIGSPRQAAVRDYLVDQIRTLGLTPQFQTTTLTRWSHRPGLAWTTAVENVLVRVPGTDSSRAILVEGHYDSVPTTAGAADCGSCTVTALEALRAIIAGPPLKNDVIFLFSDGEEVFIAGAMAFAQHPWMRDVGLALVFEGVGTSGASMLYATSPESGWWVEEALEAAPHPLAFSFLNDLMWGLAHNSGSDLDAFIADGQAGLAFVTLGMDSAPAYHTEADNLHAIDLRSVQHHGSYAVSLVRHFGNLPLDTAPRVANAIYFPIVPGVVARYPGAWALPLALLALAGFVAVVALGLWRRRLAISGTLAGIAVMLLQLVAAVVLVTGAWSAIRRANSDLHGFTAGGWYGGSFYLLAFLALTLAIVGALHLLWQRKIGPDNLAVGALAWWLLFALLTGLWLPGFSYMFAWPLLAALALLGWRYGRPERAQRLWVALPLGVPVALGLLLLAPVIQWIAFFAARLEGMLGVPLAAAPIPLAVLLLGLALPLVKFLAPARPRWLLLGALVTSLLFLGIATAQSRPDARHPRPNTVSYALDADRGQATWIALNDSPTGRMTEADLDVWTRQFFPNGGQSTTFMPWRNGLASDRLYPALEAPAPPLALPSSTVRVLADRTEGGRRQLRLHVVQPEGVLTSQVILSAAAPLQALAANATALDLTGQPAGTVQVSLIGRHSDGVTLDVVLPVAEPLTVTIQDQRPGLPAIPGVTIAPRPAWMAPAPLADVADSTLVRRTFRL